MTEVRRDASGRFVKGNQSRLGIPHSEHAKRAISQSRKGKCLGEGHPNWNPNRHNTEQVECACGCGTLIPKYDKKGRPNKWIVGHQMKGKERVFTPEWQERLQKAAIKRGEEHRGSNHWNWKGGISRANHRRETLEYRKWRLKVYERDRWTCQDCGKHCGEKDIVAHHRQSFEEYPELRYEVDNGITLCRKCHLKLHKEIE